MTDPNEDAGPRDPVETDPAALSSAEDLDEDRLRVDPLEKAMDPPEHWSAADRRGTTPWEQAHRAPLDERLAEEEPERDETAPSGEPEQADDEPPLEVVSYEESLGTSADIAGGSVPDEIRRPPANRASSSD
jgi:hypothetical protein